MSSSMSTVSNSNSAGDLGAGNERGWFGLILILRDTQATTTCHSSGEVVYGTALITDPNCPVCCESYTALEEGICKLQNFAYQLCKAQLACRVQPSLSRKGQQRLVLLALGFVISETDPSPRLQYAYFLEEKKGSRSERLRFRSPFTSKHRIEIQRHDSDEFRGCTVR